MDAEEKTASPDGTNQAIENNATEKQMMQKQITALQEQAVHLMKVLQQVSKSLSLRTDHAAKLTLDHTSITESLAQVLLRSTNDLKNTSDLFTNDVNTLRSHFAVVKALAERTAHVRLQVIKLESQVLAL